MDERYDDGTCEAQVVHGAKLAGLRDLLPSDKTAQEEAERFRALGDPTRLKILLALSRSDLCVCDIANLLGVAQSSVSQHLKILRAYGFVRFQKRGRMAVYRLADSSIARLIAPLHGKEESQDAGRRTV